MTVAVLTRTTPRSEGRRLARLDAVAARLAELHGIRRVVRDAGVLVQAGWIQHAWVAVQDAGGARHHLTAHDIDRATGGPVVGACLVGGIVMAGGGPALVRSQLVARSLELTWHTLHGDVRDPVRWCPSPLERAAHVRDLTGWNDRRGRTPQEVLSLLGRVVGAAELQSVGLRTEQLALSR